jgi:isocitrate/isopropylmalate dehydrogenase
MVLKSIHRVSNKSINLIFQFAFTLAAPDKKVPLSAKRHVFALTDDVRNEIVAKHNKYRYKVLLIEKFLFVP